LLAHPDPRDPMLLRTALRANAAFSTATGIGMLLAPAAAGALLGVDAPWVLRGIGLALLIFAVDLVWFSRSERTLRTIGQAAVAGDAAWVLGTLALATLMPGLLSTSGWMMAAGVALAVGGFAVAQALGLRRLAAPAPTPAPTQR
jgi:hypothetical protein